MTNWSHKYEKMTSTPIVVDPRAVQVLVAAAHFPARTGDTRIIHARINQCANILGLCHI